MAKAAASLTPAHAVQDAAHGAIRNKIMDAGHGM
jgi:hypothetical protein